LNRFEESSFRQYLIIELFVVVLANHVLQPFVDVFFAVALVVVVVVVVRTSAAVVDVVGKAAQAIKNGASTG
jgi:hypothetical protein